MRRAMAESVPVKASPQSAAEVFRGSPDVWLPELSSRQSGDNWNVYVWVGQIGHLVTSTVGEPSLREEGVSRRLRWAPQGTAFVRSLPRFDGILSLRGGADETAQLSLHGTYQPPYGPLGAVADRLGLSRVARATARRFLMDVAARIDGRIDGRGGE